MLTQMPFDIAEGENIVVILQRLLLINISLNPFVGYLRFYLIALWSFPLWFQLLKRLKREWIWIILFPIFGMGIRWCIGKFGWDWLLSFDYILYIPFLLTGALLFKSGYFEKIYAILAKNRFLSRRIGIVILGILLLIADFAVRSLPFSHSLSFDSWYATIFIFGIALLLQNKPKALFIPLKFLGKNSTNIWYEHAVLIFRGKFIQSIVYAPYIPILILIWAILLCLPISLLVNWIIKIMKIPSWFQCKKKIKDCR